MNRFQVYIGVDPGKKGGIASITDEAVRGWRMPQDEIEIARLLKRIIVPSKTVACIEKVHGNPKFGMSNFVFGENNGILKGIFAILEVPFVFVAANVWQKAIFDSQDCKLSTKQRSLNLARRKYPYLKLSYKADDGIADALHIVEWFRTKESL